MPVVGGAERMMRAARAQLAERVHAHVDVAALRPRRRDLLRPRPQVGQPEHDGRAGARDEQDDDHERSSLMAAPLRMRVAGSSTATRSPGPRPSLITAWSALRRSTSTGRRTTPLRSST